MQAKYVVSIMTHTNPLRQFAYVCTTTPTKDIGYTIRMSGLLALIARYMLAITASTSPINSHQKDILSLW